MAGSLELKRAAMISFEKGFERPLKGSEMQAAQAVQVAKDAVIDLFGADGLAGLRLEEIERGSDGIWNVTIGFVRPMALAGATGRTKELIDALRGDPPLGPRVYRVVRISDLDGDVLSIKIREGLD